MAAQAFYAVFGDQYRMSPAHGQSAVGIHENHVQEKYVAGFHGQRIALEEHRKVDPDGGEHRAHAVAAGIQACVGEAVVVEDSGVGIEHIAHGCAGSNGRLAGQQSFHRCLVHALLDVRGAGR